MQKNLNDSVCVVNDLSDSRADFDAVKMTVTLAQAAQWYAQETGKEPSAKAHEVRFGKRGSVSLTDKNDFVEYYDHETETGGSVIDMIAAARGCDALAALEAAKTEILHAPTASAAAHTPTAIAPTPDRAALYAALLRRVEKSARDGLKSADFKAMCEARGFDAATVAGLPRFGYCAAAVQLADVYEAHGVNSHAYIAAHTLVFWDGAQIKAIPLQPDRAYHRNGTFQLVSGAGDCRWTPCNADTDTDALFLTEGETSAIALICAGFRALPRKPDAVRAAKILDGCRVVALAYDNDAAGAKYTRAALEVLPEAVDVSQLWGDGCDPNDFLISRGKDAHGAIEKALAAAQTDEETDADAADLDPTSLQSIRRYFLEKSRRNVTEAERRAMADPLFGTFVRLLDPYRMRKHAPACVFIAWGLVRLSRYEIAAPSNPRIVNLVSRSGAGKNWTLGTLRGSHSLYYQLRGDLNVDAETSEQASVTGEGLSLAAYLWASEPGNAERCRVGVWSEFGNAQTRGYSQEERAGSIGNYDVALCAGTIQKPKSKKDVKELKGLAQEYPLNGVEIRAFQNINGSKVVIPRFAGSGEARREFWLFMTTPTDDPAFDDRTVVYADDALRNSAFMPEECDEAFGLLREAALPYEPERPQFDEEPDKRIRTRATCADYLAAYEALLKTVTNNFYRANKCELLRDKLTFCAGLSAGMHGRNEAIADDYWLAAYLCECLADSLDAIMDAGEREEDPSSERARIVGRLQAVGAKGVRSDKLTTNKKLLAELAGEMRSKDGAFIFDTDATIFWRYEAKMHRRYFLRTPDILRAVDKQKDKFKKP